MTLYIVRQAARECTLYTFGRVMVHAYDDGEIVAQDWTRGWGGNRFSTPELREERNRQVWERYCKL